ncbi:acyltransferase family protein [Erysipelothrix sp. strain 2 (EsS2-6-Brazil)]|uniref:acyltransferase family protein n=1 Tax=Erysipelothrix sp. strain 2 (EsS2-6-Brazil) TaxID=2500549 RepID=UPI00190BD328|nr:acyltransferase [Erysipelothrix sp. strain 2 (EsS2-6-Brazil)]MBK2401978.1 acyltransferase [Erysipelothrix sp. strain 2 (EsS2-6-Brazil)]
MNSDNLKLTWGTLSKYRSQIYGFTIIWIVLFHIWESFSKYITYNWVSVNFIKRGNMGVDIFLLLSGISLYYSMKNKPEQTTKEFYKKRFIPLIKIYTLVCIPFFILMRVTNNYSFEELLKQLFFMNKNVSSFWFLLVIAICYLIYPLMYKLIQGSKKGYIYVGIVLYTIILIIFMTVNMDGYKYYEILLSRIPIFLIGSTLGDLVYENKEVSVKIILGSLLVVILYGPVNLLFSKITHINYYMPLIRRYELGIQGFSFVILFVIIIQYLTESRSYIFLGKIGKITLEIYVVHIILRDIFLNVMKISVSTRPQILVFSLFFVPTSLLLGKYLSRVLDRI